MRFTDLLGESAKAHVLDFLADHPTVDFTVTEIAEKSKVSRPSVYPALRALTRTGMVSQTRHVGQSRFFKINMQHGVVQEVLRSEFRDIIDGVEATDRRHVGAQSGRR